MKVISGTARGAKLESVPGESTRPVLSRIRETVFNILRPEIPGTKWLDLFGGSGAIGIEALSNGAQSCVFVELERKAVQTINRNLKNTDLDKLARVLHVDSFRFVRSNQESFDFIYNAPPQYRGLWDRMLMQLAQYPSLLAQGGTIITQIDPKEYQTLELTEFKEVRKKQIGNTLLLFHEKS